jgi:hypothetical protein
MGTHARWLRPIITSMIQCLMKGIGQSRLPVLLMLDEFASLNHLPVIQNTIAMMRLRGQAVGRVARPAASKRHLSRAMGDVHRQRRRPALRGDRSALDIISDSADQVSRLANDAVSLARA